MNFNLALLKIHTAIYIRLNESLDLSPEKTSVYFKDVFYLNSIQQVKDTYAHNIKIIDVVFIEMNSFSGETKDIVEYIRYLNKMVPIIPIVDVINRSILHESLLFDINKYLLKPLKIQELANTALIAIQKYRRKEKMKHSLKILSDEILKFKDENNRLECDNKFQKWLLDFNQYLHESYFNQIKISDRGKVLAISEHTIQQYNLKEIIGLPLSEIFENASSIQKQMLYSLKHKSISKIDTYLQSNKMKQITLIIVPVFNQINELTYYEFYLLNQFDVG